MPDTQGIAIPEFRQTEIERTAVRESVTSGSALTGSYLAMNAAATLIAAFGLLENSPAVIIGAMLIAMLFGPIVGIALGLAEADLFLVRRSLSSEIAAQMSTFEGYASGNITRKEKTDLIKKDFSACFWCVQSGGEGPRHLSRSAFQAFS